MPAALLLRTFSSDRSHMIDSDRASPAWSCIRGADAASAHELPAFWDVERPTAAHTLVDTKGLAAFIRALPSE